MSSNSGNRLVAVLLPFGILAVLAGIVVSWLDPLWAIAGMVGIIAVGVVLYDYRVGAVCLTVLLPWFSSPLIPQTYGFNLVNFLIVASILSLAIRRSFAGESLVPLPRVVRWCYVVPIVVAALVALPHLPEGAANFPARAPDYYQAFATEAFLKAKVIKPLFFVIYALLLANAVRDSKCPERFLIAFGISAALPSLAIMVAAANGGVDQRGTYLEDLGLHPNSYGMLLALASGPLLFLTVGSGSKLSRAMSGAAFGIVSIGLLLTGSRGGALAYVIVLLTWLLRRRQLSDLVVAAVLAGFLAIVVPDTVWDRLTLGLDDTQATDIHNMDDPLTKGRVASWALLAPDILISPIWGQGIGSVAWNKASTAGRYTATLSHNMYMDILLDLGIAGFAALVYLYYRYARGFSKLSRDASLSPVLRDYFAGAFASFLGMLVMAMTNGYYMPHPEQTFLWFGLGMLFSHWSLILPKTSTTEVSLGERNRNPVSRRTQSTLS